MRFLRRRWLLAKLQRELRESWYWHAGLVRPILWPIRDPWGWWYCRRVLAAMWVGETVIEA